MPDQGRAHRRLQGAARVRRIRSQFAEAVSALQVVLDVADERLAVGGEHLDGDRRRAPSRRRSTTTGASATWW